jgi:hypothetical protein
MIPPSHIKERCQHLNQKKKKRKTPSDPPQSLGVTHSFTLSLITHFINLFRNAIIARQLDIASI